MQLFATGFNAWGQLNLKKNNHAAELSKDYHEFEEIFVDHHIAKVWASLSAVRGMNPCQYAHLDPDISTFIACLLTVPALVESSDGIHIAGCLEDWCDAQSDIFSPTVAVTGAFCLAAYNNDTKTVNQYQSPAHYLESRKQHIFQDLGNIIQTVSYETGFVALSDDGKVWTWGDKRFPACLGREVIDKSPADAPGLVTDLVELPTGKITKIAAGGYLVMALTEGNDLYAWGGHSGHAAMFDGLSEYPEPVDVDDNDVVDFSVGSDHAIILSKDGHLFAVGENTNGQLGLPKQDKLQSWTKIPFATGPSKAIVSVICGPRNTLVVVGDEDTQAAL